MSRTYRRKKSDGVPIWIGKDRVKVNGTYRWVAFTGKELKKAFAEYHSDARSGYGWLNSTPKSFRKELQKIERAKENAEVSRILKQGDYEEYEFTPHVKNAAWLYW